MYIQIINNKHCTFLDEPKTDTQKPKLTEFLKDNIDLVLDSHKTLLNEAFEFLIKHIYPKFTHHFVKDVDKDIKLSYSEVSKV